MAPKLFITGATGYIGGDALVGIVEKHPDWEITCLVRNSDKGAKVAAAFARVRLVYGDLDSADLIEEEASKADIVYHFANCDHAISAMAISKGLTKRLSPSYWIHVSGGMIIGYETISTGRYGEVLPKIFDDWEGITEVTSLPREAPHREVDEIVLGCGINSNANTAIVCPPTIFGAGRGPDNRTSSQLPMAASLALKRGKAVMVGKGQNVWNEVHVNDLTDLFVALGESAVNGGAPATWNEQGYYFAENGEFVWGDVIKRIAKEAHKRALIGSAEVESVSASEATNMTASFDKMTGTNSRGAAIRARKLLGWKPKMHKLEQDIPEMIEIEAKKANLIKGHAAKVVE